MTAAIFRLTSDRMKPRRLLGFVLVLAGAAILITQMLGRVA